MADLPSPAAHARVSRRWVIGASLAGAAVTTLPACSSSTAAEPEQGEKEQGQSTASVTPDVSTATVALAAIRASQQAVRDTVGRFPATRTPLARLAAMHAAHERTLVDAVPEQARSAAPSAPYAVPRRRDVALKRLDANEAKLHDTLQALALKAQSGDFARLLASMAAAVSVHRTALAAGARA